MVLNIAHKRAKAYNASSRALTDEIISYLKDAPQDDDIKGIAITLKATMHRGTLSKLEEKPDALFAGFRSGVSESL